MKLGIEMRAYFRPRWGEKVRFSRFRAVLANQNHPEEASLYSPEWIMEIHDLEGVPLEWETREDSVWGLHMAGIWFMMMPCLESGVAHVTVTIKPEAVQKIWQLMEAN